jgi:hypothetical protein
MKGASHGDEEESSEENRSEEAGQKSGEEKGCEEVNPGLLTEPGSGESRTIPLAM